MKLSAYIITVDAGFSPNPFGHYCTLACCKPTIRRNAKKGDIIVGTASARLPKPGHLIYAMRVKHILPYQNYSRNSRFACRKPSAKTAISRRGDNIWHYKKGNWRVVAGAFHDASHRKRDISGKNALIATEFFYFGQAAIRVPARFEPLLATTRGHKNTYDQATIDRFWKWVESKSPKPGRIDDPFDFTDEACRAQCGDIEDEDIAEA
jgi:hypothetical protein